MNKRHLAICYKPNQRVLRNELDGLLQTILKLSQFFRWHCCVYHQQEDRLKGGRAEDVFDCGEVLYQLCWQLGLGDVVGVVWGEGVLKLTRLADPGLKSKVDCCVWVKNGVALLARDGLILYKRQVLDVLHRSVKAANRNYDSSSSYFVAGPKIPAKAHSVFYFALVKVH